MNNPHSIFRRAIVCIALLTVSVVAPIAQTTKPLIDRVSVDGTRITIVGKHFGSAATASLGDTALLVVESSDTRVVGDIPPAMEGGLYILRVARNGSVSPEDAAETSVVLVTGGVR
jgi:hypothetical protein